MGPADEADVTAAYQSNAYYARYKDMVDRESAFEILRQKVESEQADIAAAEEAKAAAKAQAEADKLAAQEAKGAEKAAKEAEREAARLEKEQEKAEKQ